MSSPPLNPVAAARAKLKPVPPGASKGLDWTPAPTMLQIQQEKATQERFKAIEIDILLSEFRSVAELKESAPPPPPEEQEEDHDDAAWLQQAGLEALTEIARTRAVTDAEFQEETEGFTPLQLVAIRNRVDSMSDTIRKARQAARVNSKAVFANTVLLPSPTTTSPTSPSPLSSSLPTAPTDTTATQSSAPSSSSTTTATTAAATTRATTAASGGGGLGGATNASIRSAPTLPSLDPAAAERLMQLTSGAPEPLTSLLELSEEDQIQLQCLSLIQITTVFEQSLGYSPVSAKVKKTKKSKKPEGEVCVFGSRLDALLARDNSMFRHKMTDKWTPLFFSNLLDFLQSKGLEEEGLFRKAGGASRIRQLRATIEEHRGDCDYYKLDLHVHDACDLLKQYLREMPEPLLTNEFVEAFLVIPRITPPAHQLYTLRLLMMLLPPWNRSCLHRLVHFLCRVATHHAKNKMTLSNLAVVFAPTLFYVRGLQGQQMLKEIELQVSTAATLNIMLENVDAIWNIPPDMLAQARFVNERVSGRRANRPKDMKRILSEKRISVRPSALENASRLRWIDDGYNPEDVVRAFRLVVETDTMRILPTMTGPVRAVVVVMKDGLDYPIYLTENTTSHHLLQLLQGVDLYDIAECGGNIGCRRLRPNAHIISVLHINPGCSLVALPHGQFATVI